MQGQLTGPHSKHVLPGEVWQGQVAAQAASMSNTGAQAGCVLVVPALPALGGASKAHQWDPCTPSPAMLPVQASGAQAG